MCILLWVSYDDSPVVVFGLGTLIYEALLLKQYHEEQSLLQCVGNVIFWHNYAFLLFLVLQIYFVFKHPQVSILP